MLDQGLVSRIYKELLLPNNNFKKERAQLFKGQRI